ncbi:MAG: M23 family metallopeptidase [Pseudomonadota bacterium]
MKRRAVQRTVDSAVSGNEPPLTLTPASNSALKRGPISLRWLAGAIITGVAGAGLIGGALYTSVEGAVPLTGAVENWQIADTPQVDLGLGDRNSSTVKSDMLDVDAEAAAERKVIQASIVRNIGEKEFISLKRYELSTIPLAPTTSQLSSDLPRFNPLKIFADGGVFEVRSEDDITRQQSDPDAVAVEFTDMAAETPTFEADLILSEDEIAAAVRLAVPFDEDTELAFRPQIVPGAFGGVSFDALSAPLADIAVNGTQTPDENITTIAKSENTSDFFGADEVRLVTVEPGNTLTTLLGDSGVGFSEAGVIAQAMAQVFDPTNLQPGHQLRLAFRNANAGASLLRLSLFDGEAHLVTVARAGEQPIFTTLAEPDEAVRAVVASATSVPQVRGERANVYRGLYEAGIQHSIPRPVLNELVRVHSYDVDFQRAVQPGDHFTAFFELPTDDSSEVSSAPLYISMEIRGNERGFYRFRAPDDGSIDYYDAEGRSAKKFLIRKPMNGGRFRSGFGMRRHPILGYRRMHKGVDWSAPRGTPIVAAGNGVAAEVQWKSGYGNWVKLRHANGYETNYAHMTRHAKGLRAGQRVRQGQIIGYVGSTGLSTGPHLHYEVEVNGRHVDPMRIRLPRGRVLQGDVLAAFTKEKERITALMERPAARSTFANRQPTQNDAGEDNSEAVLASSN